MLKLAIVLVAGMLLGYTYGYHEGASGAPSIKERALEKVGAYKVRDDAKKQRQVMDQILQTHADSIDSTSHKSPAPRQ